MSELYCWCCGTGAIVDNDGYDRCVCADCAWDGSSRSTCYKCESARAAALAPQGKEEGK